VCLKNGILNLGVWNHARRYFKDAQKVEIKAKKGNNKRSKAGKALSLINKLYVIEREIIELPVNEKYQKRQEKSVPALQQLKR